MLQPLSSLITKLQVLAKNVFYNSYGNGKINFIVIFFFFSFFFCFVLVSGEIGLEPVGSTSIETELGNTVCCTAFFFFKEKKKEIYLHYLWIFDRWLSIIIILFMLFFSIDSAFEMDVGLFYCGRLGLVEWPGFIDMLTYWHGEKVDNWPRRVDWTGVGHRLRMSLLIQSNNLVHLLTCPFIVLEISNFTISPEKSTEKKSPMFNEQFHCAITASVIRGSSWNFHRTCIIMSSSFWYELIVSNLIIRFLTN